MGNDPMHVMMRQIMALFDEYQSKENAKHVMRAFPTVTPSAVISGPTLLTSLIHCAKCGGAMTIRTGKGGATDTMPVRPRSGRGQPAVKACDADGEAGRSRRQPP